MSRKRRQPTRKAWVPMTQGVMSPTYRAMVYPDGLPEYITGVEVWSNDDYEATVEHNQNGWSYITLKRYDRKAVRDWRHLQSIKNEVVGPEREAFELFPAESRLQDEANQYHLWVLPAGDLVGVGTQRRYVAMPSDTNAARIAGKGKARQRPFQPGLSTGPEAA